MVVFDAVQRWLRATGYQVTYVRNITDIEDKIIRRAVENGETIRTLTDRFIAAAMNRSVSVRMVSPFSTARRMILSSMSVMLRT